MRLDQVPKLNLVLHTGLEFHSFVVGLIIAQVVEQLEGSIKWQDLNFQRARKIWNQTQEGYYGN